MTYIATFQAAQAAQTPTPSSCSRASIIARANKFLPSTQNGLLAGFYRADLIPDEVPQEQSNLPSLTDSAFIPLQHTEGFPALPDGRPFWHKLEYESSIAFAAFEVYVSLANSGPRYLAELLHSPELQRLFEDDLTLDLLQDYFILYYWRDRAKAYDLFKEAAHRHIRVRRATSMENYHYEKAEGLLRSVMDMLGSEEVLNAMKNDPALLLSAMDKLVKIQRVSVGLPAAAPAESLKNKEETPTTFEMTMRQVLQQGASTSPTNSNMTTLDERGRVIPTTDNLLRGALNDPKAASLLQEVIIRVSHSQGATKKPRWTNTYNQDEEGADEALPEDNSEGDSSDEPT